MSLSPPDSFRLLDHLGNVIASGGTVADAMAPLPDSIARKALLAELRQMRSDAAEVQAAQARARASAVQSFYDSVIRLSHRLDAFERKRNAQLRAEAKEQEEREAKSIQDKLDAMPSIDDPVSYTYCEDPLQPHAPSQPFDEEQLRAMDATGENNQGDLPEDLLRSVPADPGDYVLNPNPVDCK
jgi:hypothetical protein